VHLSNSSVEHSVSESASDKATLDVGELLDIFELLTQPVALADGAGVIRHASAAWQVQTMSAELELGRGAELLACAEWLPGPGDRLAAAVGDVLDGRAASVEVGFEHGPAHIRLLIRACNFAGGRGALLELREASDHHSLQQIAGALRERELQFTAIAANLPGIIYRVVLHPDGTIDFPYVSPDTSVIANHPPGEHWLARIHPDDREEFFEVLRSSAEQLLPFDLEQRVVGMPGQEIWVRNITRPHQRPDGAVVWDGMVLDVTAQKLVEHDLQSSLREKDALLQEVHHRVKNNLQIISSLLDLQALTTPDPQAQLAFLESQRRIRAMALVHEQLYHVETMSQIDFGAYVRTLTDYLHQSFMPQAANITISIAIEQIWLDANSAIPCGLIISELVSNAFKHAFPARRAGAIQIACQREGGRMLRLSVADNGVGLPAPAERRTDTLGLKLVGTLVRQLRGQLTIDYQSGVVAIISFAPGHTPRDP
jgi:two-component sensor histidine kinase/PAS domain-containing protein